VKGVPGPLTILELGSGTGIIIAKLAKIINKDARGGQFQFFFVLPESLIGSRGWLEPWYRRYSYRN